MGITENLNNINPITNVDTLLGYNVSLVFNLTCNLWTLIIN